MSFSGDLEYLSIVDVIQLMHTTRKSGTLRITGRKGEISLTFDDGYIIGARHYEQGARVGNILVEAGAITQEILEKALMLQSEAGADRKPLVATLLENGLADKDAAYRGLEALIEVIIVEILTWKKGHFELKGGELSVCDEFRYFPEKLHEQLAMPTEHILMDALRIYDEKKRDGLITDEENTSDEEPADLAGVEEDAGTISADDLGLGDIDAIKRKIPGVYEGLKEFRVSAHHRNISAISPSLGDTALVDIASFLDHLPPRPDDHTTSSSPATLIFLSSDQFFIYCITATCNHEGINVFSSSEPELIAAMAEQYFTKNQPPVIILDSPIDDSSDFSEAALAELRNHLKAKHEHLEIIQLSPPHDYTFWLNTFMAGSYLTVPRPDPESEHIFIKDLKKLLTILPKIIFSSRMRTEFFSRPAESLRKAPNSLAPPMPDALRKITTIPEAAMELLKFVSASFERCLTLVVKDGELIAEKGIGINSPRESGPGENMRFRIPLAENSAFRFILDKGCTFYGKSENQTVGTELYREIGAPLNNTVLLAPLKLGKRIVSITYADFGQADVRDVSPQSIEEFSNQATLMLENAIHRSNLQKTAA